MEEGDCYRVVVGIGVWVGLKDPMGDGASGVHVSNMHLWQAACQDVINTCQVAYAETKEAQLLILQLCNI